MSGSWIRRHVLNRYVFATFIFIQVSQVLSVIHQMTAGSLVGLLFEVFYAPLRIITYTIPTVIIAHIYLATGIRITIGIYHLFLAVVVTFLIRTAVANLQFDGRFSVSQ